MSRQLLKALVTASIALMLSVIAFNNITDYGTNFELVQSVLSMEMVNSTSVQWRAVTNPSLHHGLYILIIAWEAASALFCWMGAALLLKGQSNANRIAATGLSMAFTFFMVGLVGIAGEWFYMWDSALGPLHTKAIVLSMFLAVSALYVSQSERA